MKKDLSNIAGIYLRLSRDDGVDAESNSIGTQRMILQRYAKDHGFQIYQEYPDDGYTGTNFERPAFKRMIADIEDGKLGIVLCKDMSRLGRNNAFVSFYTEIYFPDHDVRFIAINDSVDTEIGENEIMPFKSILNEYYSRDISKKVRSAKRALALAGKHISSHAPYGYIPDPNDRHKIIVDEEAAEVVRRIYQMSASGIGYCKIATILYKEQVPTPAARESVRMGKRMYGTLDTTLKYEWHGSTVEKILKNYMYLGHMVNGKHGPKSYKNKKWVFHPESEWIIVKNTHTPIISQELFDDVQRICQIKKRPMKTGEKPLFQGIMYCADCGRMMSYNSYDSIGGCYNCGWNRHAQHEGVTPKCTSHRIACSTLTDIVLSSINHYIEQAKDSSFTERIIQALEPTNEPTKKMIKEKRRLTELITITKKIVEQNALGIITDETFAQLYNGYQSEQNQLAGRIAEWEKEQERKSERRSGVEYFASLLREYDAPQVVITREMLLHLIEKIEVHEPVGAKYSRSKTHRVDIHFKGVGFFTL
ncbi:recombinase [Clostridia bacterium]|nr:recombinase [Clostridia bacterium]